MTTSTPRPCDCGHRILEHELVDHGAVSDYTRILIREKCTLCPCPKWKRTAPEGWVPKKEGKS